MSSFLLTFSLIWTVTFTSSFLGKGLGILIFLIDVLVGYMQWVEWWLFTHSVVSHSLHPCGLQHTRLPCHSVSWSLLKLMSIESVMPSNHLILCHLLLFLPSLFPSIRVFSSELAVHIRWPKYWSFSLSISPSHEYSWLISFRIDWFDYLAIQGTLKSLL